MLAQEDAGPPACLGQELAKVLKLLLQGRQLLHCLRHGISAEHTHLTCRFCALNVSEQRQSQLIKIRCMHCRSAVDKGAALPDLPNGSVGTCANHHRSRLASCNHSPLTHREILVKPLMEPQGRTPKVQECL